MARRFRFAVEHAADMESGDDASRIASAIGTATPKKLLSYRWRT
jgi:hypothetical protein